MKKIILIIILIVFPAYALEKNDALIFLKDKISQKVFEKFSEIINNSNNASSWIIDQEGVSYSLCYIKALKSKNQSIQNTLNASALSEAYMKAAVNLAFHFDNGNIKFEKFENKIAVEHVMRVLYDAKIKFNSIGKIVNGKAYYLVWSNNEKLLLSEKEFNENYCSFLYEQAQNFFKEKKFNDALKTFHQIHYRAWADISAYLGASVCFLKMNQKDDAIKLTSELINVFSKDMKPDEMANAGKILFNAGKKDKGFNALEQAYKMLSTK